MFFLYNLFYVKSLNHVLNALLHVIIMLTYRNIERMP